MRILLTGFSRAVVGGAETYLRALLGHLSAEGHELALLTELDAGPGAELVDAGAPGTRHLPVASLGQAEALRSAEAFAPDVAYHQGFVDPGLERALLDRFSTVLYAHSYYGTCISGTKLLASPRPRHCGHELSPACLARYYPRRCGGIDPRTLWSSYRLQRARHEHLPRFAAVLVAGEHMRRELARHGASSVSVAPPFPTLAAPAPEPPERPRGGRVLFASRLVSNKGGHRLLEAMDLAQARLPFPLSLDVAGQGPEEARLKALASRSRCPVTFHGWLDAGAMARLFQQADALAMPSLWPEPFGLVGLEAGCFGVPAVAFDSGGISGWLRPGRSGELVPAGDLTAAGFADALVRALADGAHHQALRRAAWEQARAHSARAHLDVLLPTLRTAAGPVRSTGQVRNPG